MSLLKKLFRARTGPLTRELLRAQGIAGLGQIPASRQPDAITTSVCGYCSTGCGLKIHLRDGAAINLSPSADYPVNRGMACPKGWEALTVLDAADRATTPLSRDASGQFVPVDWQRALHEFVARFQAIGRRHGPESIAFLGTGQIVSEELAFLGALAKFGMGMRHGDGNTRQCMASAVSAYKESFGFDAPPYTYGDLEASDVIVLVGSNICVAHPILWERVMRNPHHPEILVVDPRMTETAMNATRHLQPYPKSDQTLLYGVARILIERGGIDPEFIYAHTHGFQAFRDFVQQFPVDRVERETGLAACQIETFAETIQRGKRVSFWWTMGVNQSHQGTRTAQAIINLALMTGNIGRPGAGANSITGQCNAMGSRLFSNTTNLLGGHDFANPAHRAKVATALGIDRRLIPADDSWSYHEIIEGILRGEIRGLWIVGTNPAHSWINQNQARDILDRLDFLVVQDMYHSTETARMADLVLPAAAWGEKTGTFINSERRIGLVRNVRRAPGEALSDFHIFRLISQAWGVGDLFKKWTSPEEAFQILKQCTRDMPCDITGVRDYRMIEQFGGVQWPWPADDAAATVPPATERRLFTDGRFFHSDGRARFCFEPPRPLKERPDGKFPLLLLTGRGSSSQWHTQTRTSKSAVLRKLYPNQPFAEINPEDARRCGVKRNDWMIVTSQRGHMRALAVFTHNVRPGQVFIPMHYEETNRLTDAVFDPYSKQPAYKACAVNIRRAEQ